MIHCLVTRYIISYNQRHNCLTDRLESSVVLLLIVIKRSFIFEDVLKIAGRNAKVARYNIHFFQDVFHTVTMVTSHVYKRAAQEMTDVNTSRIIQVVAPGDVNFALGSSNANNDTTVVIQNASSSPDSETICMSLPGFVGGLVMLLLVVVVASLVAAFLFVRVRAIDRKSAGMNSMNYVHPAYITENPELVKVANWRDDDKEYRKENSPRSSALRSSRVTNSERVKDFLRGRFHEWEAAVLLLYYSFSSTPSLYLISIFIIIFLSSLVLSLFFSLIANSVWKRWKASQRIFSDCFLHFWVHQEKFEIFCS